jgi:molybdenum cofactor cytidylyltransferase
MLSWSGAPPVPGIRPPHMSNIACAAVILAAGASRRLGEPKQLVAIAGEPLLVRAVRLAREGGFDPVVVVTGFESGRMRAVLAATPAIIAENEEWGTGMGSSLRCGIAALGELDPSPPNALVLVCDQLALSAEVLRELARVHACEERPITASFYSGRAGAPAIFSAQYYPELMRVEGDRGAGGILERHSADVALVKFEDGALDLDTPEQLRGLASRSAVEDVR